MAKELIFNIKATGGDKAAGDINKIGDASKNASGGVKGVGGSLSGLAGPSKAAAGGFAAVGKSMLAMLANPVGIVIAAIVGAFLALKKALSSTEAGQNKMSKAMAVLATIVDKLFDALEPLATFIFDKIVKGFEDFGKVVDMVASGISSLLEALDFTDAAASLDSFVAATERAARGAALVADARAIADKKERELVVERAKLDAKIAQAKEVSNDKEKFSIAERQAAVQEASDLNEELFKKEEKIASLRLKAIQTENALTNSNKEALEAEAQAEADLINLQTKRANNSKALGRERLKLNKEAQKENEKVRKESAAKTKKAAELLVEEEQILRDLRIQNIEDDTEREKAITDAKFDDKLATLTAKFGAESEVIIALETERQASLDEIDTANFEKKLEKERSQAETLAALRLELKELSAGELTDEASPEERMAFFEAKNALEDEQFALEQERLMTQLAGEEVTKEEFDVRSDILTKKHSDNKDKIAKDSVEFDKKLNKQKVANAQNAASNILGSIASMAAEGSAIGKAAAVGQATMDTYKSAVAAYAAGSSVGGPAGLILGPLAAGLAVAAGILNVKKILSTKTPGGTAGGGAAPTASAAPVPTAASITPDLFPTGDDFEGTEPEEIGTGAGVRQQQPIRAFVTEMDITETQENLSTLKQESEIG